MQEIVHKWHEHMQIYVATIYQIFKYQNSSDSNDNNFTVSQDLQLYLDLTKNVLCNIHQSMINMSIEPYFFSYSEMSKIVTLKKNKQFLNNLFVKVRLQHYIAT